MNSQDDIQLAAISYLIKSAQKITWTGLNHIYCPELGEIIKIVEMILCLYV